MLTKARSKADRAFLLCLLIHTAFAFHNHQNTKAINYYGTRRWVK